MDPLAINNSDFRKALNLHNTKIRVIAGGFSIILVFVVVTLLLWTSSVTNNSSRLQNVVDRQTQTRLLATMLYAVQRRSLSLHQMSDLTDPFEQDDKYLEFRKLGEMYLLHREKLLATGLSVAEKQILHDVDQLASFGGHAQEKVANLIMQGQTKQAKASLLSEIASNQISLIDKLRSIFESQRNLIESELIYATTDQRSTKWFILLVGIIGASLTLFTIFIVKRTANSEKKSLIQGQWLKALYQISSSTNLSYDEQLQATLQYGCSLLNMEIGKVCQIDTNKNINRVINVVAPQHYSLVKGTEIPLEKSFCSFTITNDQPVCIPDVHNSNYATYPCYEFSQIESYIALPLYVNQEKFGTVNFSSTKSHPPFADEDLDLVRLITNWISVALEKQTAQKINVAKESAEAANETKSNFLASMSHELRTPLHAILGYNELLRDEVNENGDTNYLKDIEKIEVAGRHLLSLINDVLDLSKIEAGKLEIHIEPFSLKPLISEIESTIAPLTEKNQNVFHLEYDDNINLIKSDLTKIRQILLNLLSNAAKFTQSGIVKLTVKTINIQGNDWLEIVIKDTGIGMTREQLNKIFVSFSQADSSTQRKYGGTGLGLAITSRLCQIMGGSISADSVPGVGSTFVVQLPAILEVDGTDHSKLAAG